MGGECGLESMAYGWGLMSCSCEHGNEPMGSIKTVNFLNTWQSVDFPKNKISLWFLASDRNTIVIRFLVGNYRLFNIGDGG
jgi:hypothetical protein